MLPTSVKDKCHLSKEPSAVCVSNKALLFVGTEVAPVKCLIKLTIVG